MTKRSFEILAMDEEDFKSAAGIMSQAFRSKMPLMKNFTDHEVAEFMLAGGLFDPSYLEGYYIGKVDGCLVGIIHLESWQSRKAKPSPPKDLRRLFSQFGVIRVLLSGLGLVFLEERLMKDELYVDFIAIDRSYRGQGIGSALLKHGEAIGRAMTGIRRYTLGVIDENKRARQLYEQLGFMVYETKSSRLTELFTGVRVSHKLEKLI